MIGYVKHFDSNKTMPFKVSVITNCYKGTKNMEKICNLLDIEFDSEPFYGHYDKHIKTKIKLYGDKYKFSRQKSTKRKRTDIIDNVRLSY